ncbi:Site-specific DNA recombinase [Jatrophihabitans endophyticus]|uniref:Site-specific DNA recombinase n=1 Tax=Jatrophihabitans endophyticus TaxID=1206085 RepID=A0A1M5HBG5_9ACTN|nr:recombinase family protein [Jatrophihabitans endophyticus]SHG13228.1 Site-specific DNA recombinase [Jatrophihabitans endophyticus]
MNDKGQVVAYLRVSTTHQKLDRQQDITEGTDKVFEEHASGTTRERPQLKAMLDYVREGDHIRVWSMDRLARSLLDLQNIVGELVSRGVSVEFVKNNLTFQPNAKKDPYATFQLQILGAVAELERNIIMERQAEGIAKAKLAGKYAGRKPSLTSDQVSNARERIALGVPKAAVARDLGVCRATLYRALADDAADVQVSA